MVQLICLFCMENRLWTAWLPDQDMGPDFPGYGIRFPRIRGSISEETEPDYLGSFPSGSHQGRQGSQGRSKWSRLAPGVGNGTRFSVTWRPEGLHGPHKGMVSLDCTTGIALLGVLLGFLYLDCSAGILLQGLLSWDCFIIPHSEYK